MHGNRISYVEVCSFGQNQERQFKLVQMVESRQRLAPGEPKAALAHDFRITREILSQYLRTDD